MADGGVKLEATANFSGECKRCGVPFVRYVRPSRKPPQYCSPQCRGRDFAGVAQTAEHIANRLASNPRPNWKGDEASERSGRSRALRWYPEKRPCEGCGNLKADRHHVDGNTLNNARSNIEYLCRSCHMKKDGRLAALIETSRGRAA